jgi:hypothetical protein
MLPRQNSLGPAPDRRYLPAVADAKSGVVMNRAEDPVLVSARREALIVLVIWLGAMTYTVTACWICGYGRDPATLRFVFGFPDWVFWGIISPWLVCFGLSYIFSHWIMRDDPLGEDVGEAWEDEFGEEGSDG